MPSLTKTAMVPSNCAKNSFQMYKQSLRSNNRLYSMLFPKGSTTCVCGSVDLDPQMILCTSRSSPLCSGWYHLRCQGLNTFYANKIDLYVCTFCLSDLESKLKAVLAIRGIGAGVPVTGDSTLIVPNIGNINSGGRCYGGSQLGCDVISDASSVACCDQLPPPPKPPRSFSFSVQDQFTRIQQPVYPSWPLASSYQQRPFQSQYLYHSYFPQQQQQQQISCQQVGLSSGGMCLSNSNGSDLSVSDCNCMPLNMKLPSSQQQHHQSSLPSFSCCQPSVTVNSNNVPQVYHVQALEQSLPRSAGISAKKNQFM